MTLSTADAAKRLGISVRAVQLAIQRGRLHAEKRGRDWWITETEVQRYDRERQRRRIDSRLDSHPAEPSSEETM